jgi:Eukaryotic mitochondrial regulator protein
MANPETNTVRSLASRFHLSIKRVDAILRLKGLEESWIKVSPPYLASLAKFWLDDVHKISLEDLKDGYSIHFT